MNNFIQLLTHDITLYKLSPILNDISNYRLFTTNKYIYNLVSKVKLKEQHRLENVLNTKFIPTNISIDVYDVVRKDCPLVDTMNLENETLITILNDIRILINEGIDKLSHNIETLKFRYAFEVYLNKLPPNLKKLILGSGFSKELMRIMVKPKYLTASLELNRFVRNLRHEYPINFEDLPSSIEVLDLSYCVLNGSIDNLQLANIQTLELPNKFNQPINHLPQSLRDLTVGYNFNHPIDHLPINLQLLDLAPGRNFNQSIDHLPGNLHILFLPENFNQSIDHLPNNLYELHLSWNYNRPIDNLPCNLRKLTLSFPREFNYPIEKLPPKLQSLTISCRFSCVIRTLPSTLKDLRIYNTDFNTLIEHYPNSLQKLTIGEEIYHFNVKKCK
jgi:hypothetical protein